MSNSFCSVHLHAEVMGLYFLLSRDLERIYSLIFFFFTFSRLFEKTMRIQWLFPNRKMSCLVKLVFAFKFLGEGRVHDLWQKKKCWDTLIGSMNREKILLIVLLLAQRKSRIPSISFHSGIIHLSSAVHRFQGPDVARSVTGLFRQMHISKISESS